MSMLNLFVHKTAFDCYNSNKENQIFIDSYSIEQKNLVEEHKRGYPIRKTRSSLNVEFLFSDNEITPEVLTDFLFKLQELCRDYDTKAQSQDV